MYKFSTRINFDGFRAYLNNAQDAEVYEEAITYHQAAMDEHRDSKRKKIPVDWEYIEYCHYMVDIAEAELNNRGLSTKMNALGEYI